MNSFLEGLNPVQKNAVTETSGPVMVIAGPGSGKTRVLTYRLAYLIQSGVKPHNILSLTFTNKAAKEMTERISHLVGNEVRKVWSGTFHSIFARILRVEAPKIGYPSSFSIYDTEDSKSTISEIIKELNLNPKEYNVNSVRMRISSAKSNLITPIMYERDSILLDQDRENKMPETFRIYKKYVQHCVRGGAMDFDDLLLQLFRLLQENPDQVLEKYRKQFQYVLVDEFQDTNYLQYAIIKKLVLYKDSPRNICIVGDDAQSIYAFRGATIKNILDFEQDFPDAKIFKLEQNYRSTQHIVKAANDVINYNAKQIKKEIWTEIESGHKIKLLKCTTDVEEGRKVADYIVELKNRFHLKNKEIAILYRTNAQSRIFEEQLRRVNILYKVFGGMSFYQRKEIKDLLAYLRLIVNLKDNEAFKRIINYPKRGIGDTTVDKFIAFASENDCSLWEACTNFDLSPRTAQSLKQFKMQIQEVQQYSLKSDAYNTAMYAFKLSGMSAELKQDLTNEGIQRLENVMALLDGVKTFTEEDEVEVVEGVDKSLTSYLQSISLISEMDQADETADYVTLMSVHSAKGLEYRGVIVAGMEENLFPSYMATKDADQIDEERRLFYVAITRAKQHLALSYASTRYLYGNLKMCEPSRFIDEIESERMEIDKNAKNAVFDLLDDRPVPKQKWVLSKPKYIQEPIKNFLASPSESIQSGMQVIHQKFGRGKVIHIEGKSDTRVATILFQEIDNPQRKIILKFAKLQIVN
ncbi:MAG: UvrD-helicase domain-containing protein [Saprospiraceae bacterium]|nr:UvrD-helicase domain-containing protein [Saprospiraceae bacterium]MBK8450515.1 UvrD-helicase domain-containing protein [Saprospiraceae bacterium]MBK8485398.1 UvrD-helicase domain-containing protein [Saprospiraceae bacterium]MBK9720328.1 UvrD-helicase domain-containing protein [Saprospiraceae bacterium]MBK9727323.1 UvrD-helicase domain-containing protein [Saprospiraceae bacterium]